MAASGAAPQQPPIDAKALKDVFNISESVIAAVLKNEKGMDDAVDTLLNMASDPLRQPVYEPARTNLLPSPFPPVEPQNPLRDQMPVLINLHESAVRAHPTSSSVPQSKIGVEIPSVQQKQPTLPQQQQPPQRRTTPPSLSKPEVEPTKSNPPSSSSSSSSASNGIVAPLLQPKLASDPATITPATVQTPLPRAEDPPSPSPLAPLGSAFSPHPLPLPLPVQTTQRLVADPPIPSSSSSSSSLSCSSSSSSSDSRNPPTTVTFPSVPHMTTLASGSTTAPDLTRTTDFQPIAATGEKRFVLPEFVGERGRVVCPTSARVGDTVEVSWDLGPKMQPHHDDWIGLFKQNQPSNHRYIAYQKTGGARSGSLHFTVPALGSWEFRFFPNKSYDYTLRSNLLVAGCNVQLLAVLDPSAPSSHPAIKLTLRLVHGQLSSSDWIGLYKTGTYHNKEYLANKYVGEDRTFTFDAPRQPGQYELRYFPAGSSYNDVARSNLITIEDRDMIVATPSRVVFGSNEKIIGSWRIISAETSKWDWVGLYPVDGDTYLAYHYVEPGKNSATFECPAKPGEYELRYCLAATSSLLSTGQVKRSNKILVMSSATATV